ncbi:hypothetical protein B0T09DRAFT_396378 [Sordaria sp. MPI-SDFR-AT-0083]|nr:hypothetical protein B0T09DRAFT_396378 [Sordaria sp. MPI-SDFR-AT-0083]
MTLQKLSLELLETVAGFCGDIASVAPDEQTSTFTNAIVNPYLDSATSNTSSWSPAQPHLYTVPLIDSTPINLHTMEDQLLTATVQLCPNLAATRISFGSPQRYPPQEARQPIQEPSVYVSLAEDHSSKLTSLSLDFGALLWQTNLQDYVPGYPAGLPPSVERLTLVGNELEPLQSPYFDLKILTNWLNTNNCLRELRMLYGFDKLVTYRWFVYCPVHPAPQWPN